MGAKQSKRSVDISGKEAESAGEVAAAGAGGEGRVEQLSDADALKPQLNGVSHKGDEKNEQKEIENGAPENEKDAVTENEEKKDEEKPEPLTNGDSEPKVENGESTPVPEDGKKPKKEKVKKKWSLRSISFSRKDKPKQEKKQKDDEPKTNGEQEKVPEEAAEVVPEVAVTAADEEVKSPTENKEEKAPETPVTEPITNGSTTPESETVLAQETEASSPKEDAVENKLVVEPEQLPVNGLTLEEPKQEATEIIKPADNKEEPAVELPEVITDISVKKEVCVEQMSLIDPTPPPLPANPPPSSVVSFAATTMAPEPSDAALPNTAENTLPPPLSSNQVATKQEESPVESDNKVLPTVSDPSNESESCLEQPLVNSAQDSDKITAPLEQNDEDISSHVTEETIIEKADSEAEVSAPVIKNTSFPKPTEIDESNIKEESEVISKCDEIPVDVPASGDETVATVSAAVRTPPSQMSEEVPAPPPVAMDETKLDEPNSLEDLPTPPPPICDDDEFDTQQNAALEQIDNKVNEIKPASEDKLPEAANEIIAENSADNVDQEQNVITKDSLGNVVDKVECNGNIDDDKLVDEHEIIDNKNLVNNSRTTLDAEESTPDPQPDEPSSPPATQEAIIPASDKLADLIPEIPDVPELKTETLQETTTDVAVTN